MKPKINQNCTKRLSYFVFQYFIIKNRQFVLYKNLLPFLVVTLIFLIEYAVSDLLKSLCFCIFIFIASFTVFQKLYYQTFDSIYYQTFDSIVHRASELLNMETLASLSLFNFLKFLFKYIGSMITIQLFDEITVQRIKVLF